MKYQMIAVYIALCSFLGVYGLLFSPFYPEIYVKKFAVYFSVALFLIISAVAIWLTVSNKSKLIIKFRRPRNFYVFIFAVLPSLLGFVALLHYGAWSRGIPSIYTQATTESVIISSEVVNKRLWGRNDRHEEIFISGYSDGFPVSRRYYQSVNIGQTIAIGIRKSKLGTHLEFL